MIGSWQYDTTRINFVSSDGFVDLTSYTQHPIWFLYKVEVYKVYTNKRFLTVFKYKSGDVGFYLLMQRGSMYTLINNLFPCFVLNLIVLAAFWIPFPPPVYIN